MAKPVTSLNNKLKRDAKSGRFLQGNHSGGRPIGSRPKLAAQFLDDVHALWLKKGAESLKRMADKEPSKFCTLVAGLLPRELDMTINNELGAETREFLECYRYARKMIGVVEPVTIEADG
jgi:hypothetical protein